MGCAMSVRESVGSILGWQGGEGTLLVWNFDVPEDLHRHAFFCAYQGLVHFAHVSFRHGVPWACTVDIPGRAMGRTSEQMGRKDFLQYYKGGLSMLSEEPDRSWQGKLCTISLIQRLRRQYWEPE